MSNEDKPNEALSGEIIPGERGAGNTLDLKLQQPPDAATVPFATAILQQYRYWGLRRTLRTYRHAVESGVAAVEVQTRFYQAARELDMEKARWGNREQYREAVRKEAEALLVRVEAETEEARARTEEAKTRRVRSQLERRTLQEQIAAADILEEIAENNRAAELAQVKRRREEEEQRLADQKSGAKTSDFKQKRAEFEQARADYQELMDMKAADIETYGSEENFPGWLMGMYEKMEDDIGFRDD